MVSTPKPIGVPVASCTSMIPRAHSPATKSKCGVSPRTTTPSATRASKRPERHEIAARQRKLEAARHVEYRDVFFSDVALAQRAFRPVHERIGKLFVESRRDDREAAAGAVGKRQRAAAGLHEAATSSIMWPSFERLVSM